MGGNHNGGKSWGEIRDNDPLPSVKCSEIVPQCAPETPNVLGTYGQIA